MKQDSPHHFPDRASSDEPHAKLLEEVQSRQRNIDWRDAMRNSRSVDELFWRGSPEATIVQRVGIAVFGLLFLSLGLFFFALENLSVPSAVAGVFVSALD